MCVCVWVWGGADSTVILLARVSVRREQRQIEERESRRDVVMTEEKDLFISPSPCVSV